VREKNIDEQNIPWASFFCVALGVYMATLDGSIVAVALPSIRADFGARLGLIQWVLSIYMLVITGLLLAAGRVADIVGQKGVFLGGLSVFTAGSLLCAAAPTAVTLIVARGIQGIGGAMLMAAAPAIVTATFPPSHRGRGLGLTGTVVGLGLTTGPPLGGLLLDLLGWRAIFYINLPIGIGAVAYGLAKLPPLKFTKPGQRFDLSGTLLFSAACATLLTASSKMGEHGSSPPYLIFIVSAILFGGFVLREKRAADPLIRLSLFKNRRFTFALAASLLTFISGIVSILFLPFYLTGVVGLSTSTMGMVMMVTPLVMMSLAHWAGGLSDRIGYRLLTTTGLIIRAGAFVAFILIDPDSSLALTFAGLLLLGVGTAIFMSPNTSSVMGAVPPQMLGVAGSLTAVARNLGMALGVALGAAVFDIALVKAGGTSIGTASLSNHPAFMTGWRAAMGMALAVCLSSVVISHLRGKDPERSDN